MRRGRLSSLETVIYTESMAVYVNRMLNLKKIKLIGFDMDYTLVRYNVEEFEKLAHSCASAWLVKERAYPTQIASLPFDLDRAVVGLVIDKVNGNLLKLSCYGKVKAAYHGLQEIDFRLVRQIYQNVAIELRDPEYTALDTSFAISVGVLFSQIVQLKSDGVSLPDFARIASDVLSAVDMVHRNGAIKSIVLKDFERFVVKDPDLARLLERYKEYGKKLMVITNSDYAYTRALLEYAIDPFLTKHNGWRDVFDLVITLADKPRFFERPNRFLAIQTDTGLMQNHDANVASGVFQGGWFKQLQEDFGLIGGEILYIGDHIYGDVVSIKKHCDWRTALVLGDLEAEVSGIRRGRNLQQAVESLMSEKTVLEKEINQLDLARHEGRKIDHRQLDSLFEQTDAINVTIADKLAAYRSCFNPYWGEILRSGQEESRYADQMDRYACIYMCKVSDLYDYSPKTYFRPQRRLMPHELEQ